MIRDRAEGGEPPCLLVVDDALVIRAYLERVFGDAGVRVETALNGQEGLEKVMLLAPDLVICDVNMPVLSGMQMVTALRADAAVGATPVVMLTTEADAHDREQARAAGANFYMVKPPQPEHLLAIGRLLLSEGTRWQI